MKHRLINAKSACQKEIKLHCEFVWQKSLYLAASSGYQEKQA